MAEEAKILVEEAWENNLDSKAFDKRWRRWDTCSLCEQRYHGVVACALGWACWKTYVGRLETDEAKGLAMTQLGNGLSAVGNWADALSVREAELSTLRRIGAPLSAILAAQGNLANTYQYLGRLDEALPLRQDVYSGRVRLSGEEHELTLVAANNYASSLVDLQRFEEAKALLRKTNPVARRVIGASHELTLRMGWTYALALYKDDSATLTDLREAVTTLVETTQTARRVLGGAHPLLTPLQYSLRNAGAALSGALAARDPPSGGA